MEKRKLAILGSTGSIGRNTLEVISRFPEKFEVVALAAGDNIKLLAQQAQIFRPRLVSCRLAEKAQELKKQVPSSTQVLHGEEGVLEIATHEEIDLLVSALVGAIGLLPTYYAVDKGIDVALANKESLVMAGDIIMERAQKTGAKILPVDSEHSAIFQALQGNNKEDVAKIILTASGGPFRQWPKEKFIKITKEQALKHPNWSMGAKITIDSATLMNKGLEVIEALYLFQIPLEKIEVKIHPQSIVHSLVEYIDGSVIAQLGPPDMRIPIAYALGYPNRLPLEIPRLDLVASSPLTFEEPDLEKFPCLRLAYEAARKRGTAPAILNAVNEVAVQKFLQGRLPFHLIPALIEEVLNQDWDFSFSSLEDILNVDILARIKAEMLLDKFIVKETF